MRAESRKLSLTHIVSYGKLLSVSDAQFTMLEDLTVENQYGSCIVSNIVRQLLAFSPRLQHLSLQLVDSLDDLLWAEIFNSNNLRHLLSVNLDQCHSISGDSLQVSRQYFRRTNIKENVYCST